jgi:hypothetical protein
MLRNITAKQAGWNDAERSETCTSSANGISKKSWKTYTNTTHSVPIGIYLRLYTYT